MVEEKEDIVELLRDPAYPPKPAGSMALRLSAADEIELLRAANDRLFALVDEMQDTMASMQAQNERLLKN